MAEHAGFCYGVKRAVLMAEEALQKEAVTSLGSLIHNKQEVNRLKELGLNDDLEDLQNNSVLIRSHGIDPEGYNKLKQQGNKIIDATCPNVRKAQILAKEAYEQGFQVIILGNKDHVEVEGIRAWTNNKAIVVASVSELSSINLQDKVAVLAQTTEKECRFAEIVDYLKEKVFDLEVLSTICSATKIRQEATRRLAQKVDVMLVIGGKHSSNTKKLAEISKACNVNTYLIEEAKEIQACWFKNKLNVGVTAGASTPDWIIKEVTIQMEEIKKEINKTDHEEIIVQEQEATKITDDEVTELQNQIEINNLQQGDMVKGIVVKISNEDILVDVGGKSEGIIPETEFISKNINLQETLNIGDEILVEVIDEDKDGNIILSRKQAYFDELLEKLEAAKNSGEIIDAPVIEIVKGGLLVDVGVRGFVPASQVERSFVEDFQQYLGKKLRLKVTEIDKEKQNVVLSQRIVLEEEYQKQKEALWEEIEEGQTRKGVVKRLTNFGAFVDIGGTDGLIHISELGWGKVNHPSEVLKVNDEIEVYVLKIDKDKEKISLSLKALLGDPFENAISKFAVNSIVKGKVVRIVTFGAFVELEPGVEGLVHISMLSDKRINKVEEVLSEGQEIEVKIVEIDKSKKRIALSIKDIKDDKEKADFKTYLDQHKQEDKVTIGDLIKINKSALFKDSTDK